MRYVGDFCLLSAFNSHSFLLEWRRLGASETEEKRFNIVGEAFTEGVSLAPFATWIQLSATITDGGKTYKVILHQWHKRND